MFGFLVARWNRVNDQNPYPILLVLCLARAAQVAGSGPLRKPMAQIPRVPSNPSTQSGGPIAVSLRSDEGSFVRLGRFKA